MGLEDPLRKEMATYSSILACEIPRTEEPAGLQFMGSQRVGYDLMAKSPPPPLIIFRLLGLPGGSVSKESPCNVVDSL